jgi:hypothetical protein
MSGVVTRILAAAVSVAALCWPVLAVAGQWPVPVAGSVALRFAETWRDAGGRPRSHGGLDLAAPAGSRVRACAAGTVAFAGRVPGAGGGTVLAVTVLTADGLKVTFMPLASAEVSDGAPVTVGDAIGILAGSGDGSTSAEHLHVSVRRGERQIDPEPFLDLTPAPAPVLGGDAGAGGSVPPASSVPLAPGRALVSGVATTPRAQLAAPLAVADRAVFPAPAPVPPEMSADVFAAMAARLRAAIGARPHVAAHEVRARTFPTRAGGVARPPSPGVLRLPDPDPALGLRVALAVGAALALMRALPRTTAAQRAGGAPAGRAG